MRDIRDAIRALRAGPGFTGIALIALTLGIDATTAIYSVAESVSTASRDETQEVLRPRSPITAARTDRRSWCRRGIEGRVAHKGLLVDQPRGERHERRVPLLGGCIGRDGRHRLVQRLRDLGGLLRPARQICRDERRRALPDHAAPGQRLSRCRQSDRRGPQLDSGTQEVARAECGLPHQSLCHASAVLDSAHGAGARQPRSGSRHRGV